MRLSGIVYVFHLQLAEGQLRVSRAEGGKGTGRGTEQSRGSLKMGQGLHIFRTLNAAWAFKIAVQLLHTGTPKTGNAAALRTLHEMLYLIHTSLFSLLSSPTVVVVAAAGSAPTGAFVNTTNNKFCLQLCECACICLGLCVRVSLCAWVCGIFFGGQQTHCSDFRLAQLWHRIRFSWTAIVAPVRQRCTLYPLSTNPPPP